VPTLDPADIDRETVEGLHGRWVSIRSRLAEIGVDPGRLTAQSSSPRPAAWAPSPNTTR
jgi:hypothetical protein